jgi:hypothetical protein
MRLGIENAYRNAITARRKAVKTADAGRPAIQG